MLALAPSGAAKFITRRRRASGRAVSRCLGPHNGVCPSADIKESFDVLMASLSGGKLKKERAPTLGRRFCARASSRLFFFNRMNAPIINPVPIYAHILQSFLSLSVY